MAQRRHEGNDIDLLWDHHLPESELPRIRIFEAMERDELTSDGFTGMAWKLQAFAEMDPRRLREFHAFLKKHEQFIVDALGAYIFLTQQGELAAKLLNDLQLAISTPDKSFQLDMWKLADAMLIVAQHSPPGRVARPPIREGRELDTLDLDTAIHLLEQTLRDRPDAQLLLILSLFHMGIEAEDIVASPLGKAFSSRADFEKLVRNNVDLIRIFWGGNVVAQIACIKREKFKKA